MIKLSDKKYAQGESWSSSPQTYPDDRPQIYPDDKEHHACGASSSKLPYGANGIDQIPFHSECRIGAIFLEGEEKHGRDNWKKGAYDEGFHRERLMHIRTHLQLYLNGDRSEDHLAKVAWGAIAVMELQRLMMQDREQAAQATEQFDAQIENAYKEVQARRLEKIQRESIEQAAKEIRETKKGSRR